VRSACKILVGYLKGRDHSERLGIDEDMIIDVREIGWECVEWIHLAQDKNQWLAVVKTVINFRVP
jgi:hypothetical protein